MDITKLAKIQRQASPKTKLVAGTAINGADEFIYEELSITVAELFSKLEQKDECLVVYCKTLAAFLRVADVKKWTYLLLLSSEKEKKLANKWKARSNATVYLALQQQLLKAYLERRSGYLVRAWDIFIKFGLTDLRYSSEEIEKCFGRLYERVK